MKIEQLVEFIAKDSPAGKFLDRLGVNTSTDKIGSEIDNAKDKIGNAFSNMFKSEPNVSSDTTTPKSSSAITTTTSTKNTVTDSRAVSIDDLAREMDSQGITDPNLRKAIVAKFYQESGKKYGTTEEPFGGTSNKRIKEKLPQLSSMSDEELTALKKSGPENFFNRAYGYKGNTLGNNEPGDGYKYRGRGLTGITGKVNYQRVDDALGLKGELVKNPDLLLDPKIDRAAAVWFYKAAGGDKVTFASQEDANKWAIYKAGGQSYAPGTKLGNDALADLNKKTAVIAAVTATGVVAGPTLVRKAETVIDKIKGAVTRGSDKVASAANQAINTAKNTAKVAAVTSMLGSGSGGGSSGGGYSGSSRPFNMEPEEEVTLIINGKRRKFRNKREAKIAMEIARSQGADVKYA